MIFPVVVVGAVVVAGLLSALQGLQSGERHRVAGGAAYLVALVATVAVWAGLAVTVWEDDAHVVDRTTGTVERLLREEAVVRVDDTQVRILAPRIPHRPQEGDEVLVTIDRAGLYDVELRRTPTEVDATIADNLRRRPPAPIDAAWLVVPLAAAGFTGAAVWRRRGRPPAAPHHGPPSATR